MIKDKPSQKFFERFLDISQEDIDSLYDFCIEREKDMLAGKFPGITKEEAENKYAQGAMMTRLLGKYNVFQLHHPVIRDLLSAVREMTKEACEYYGADFKSESYYIQGWINVEKEDDCSQEYYIENNVQSNMHEHCGGLGFPDLHGYFCVNAEPSTTYYNINKTVPFDNVNKNLRAILSETGHPHSRGWWGDKAKRRVTIAYDTRSVNSIDGRDSGIEQHWIPLI
jgi:hypothetical protein